MLLSAARIRCEWCGLRRR